MLCTFVSVNHNSSNMLQSLVSVHRPIIICLISYHPFLLLLLLILILFPKHTHTIFPS